MRILVGYVEDLKHSGIDKYLLGVLKVALKNDVQLDFLTSNYSEDAEKYLENLGCRLFSINNLKKPLTHYGDVREIVEKGGYDKAYFNISEPLNMMGAKAAHDAGIEVMLHSHSSGMDISNKYKRFIRGLINKICKPFLWRYGDKFFACSKKAGYWLYPKKVVESDKFHVIYNAVDTSRFCPDERIRAEKRLQLSIDDDTIVIGHIGNYCYQKNNFFLVDIMSEFIKLNKKAVMLCVGDGADRTAVETYAKEKGVADVMNFMGIRSDVNELIKAMDVFVLPSRFEGLPVVAVEAQLSGVACIVSSNISDEVILSTKTVSLDLSSAQQWAEKISEAASNENNAELLSGVIEKYSLDNQKEQIINTILIPEA